MDQVLNFLEETVKPLTEDTSVSDSERNVLIEGYGILQGKQRDIMDRIQSASELFISVDRYLETLKNKIETIIQPLLEDVTIENADKEAFELIQEGHAILTDDGKEMKDRIQLACDKIDEAQYRPYNPYHSRVALARAIATYEYGYGGKEFKRSKKSELTN